jgi:hypothetical protein
MHLHATSTSLVLPSKANRSLSCHNEMNQWSGYGLLKAGAQPLFLYSIQKVLPSCFWTISHSWSSTQSTAISAVYESCSQVSISILIDHRPPRNLFGIPGCQREFRIPARDRTVNERCLEYYPYFRAPRTTLRTYGSHLDWKIRGESECLMSTEHWAMSAMLQFRCWECCNVAAECWSIVPDPELIR